jgi:hypothetical protein
MAGGAFSAPANSAVRIFGCVDDPGIRILTKWAIHRVLLSTSTPIYGGADSFIPHLLGSDILARFMHWSKIFEGRNLKNWQTLRFGILL